MPSSTARWTWAAAGPTSCRPLASLHAEDEPDWRGIAVLYGELSRVTGSPVAALNHATAVAETEGPDAASSSSTGSRRELDDFRYFHATRADLLRRLGRASEARAEYARALDTTADETERRFLRRRLAE